MNTSQVKKDSQDYQSQYKWVCHQLLAIPQVLQEVHSSTQDQGSKNLLHRFVAPSLKKDEKSRSKLLFIEKEKAFMSKLMSHTTFWLWDKMRTPHISMWNIRPRTLCST